MLKEGAVGRHDDVIFGGDTVGGEVVGLGLGDFY